MSQCVACLYEQAKNVTVDDSKTNIDWGVEIGVSEAGIRRHKRHAEVVAQKAADATTDVDTGVPGSSEFHDDKGAHYSEFSDKAWGYEDFRNFIRSRGQDPDKVTFNWGWTSNPGGGFWNKLNNVKPIKDTDPVTEADWAVASRFIEDFTYIPAKREFLTEAAILQPTDEQLGKTDYLGGSDGTIERVMNSYSAFVDYVRDYRPREILIAHTGDGIENFCNTSSQAQTNDLDLPHMILELFKLDLAGLKMLAPEAERVINAQVPSNHGRWRSSLKSDAGDPHADFGISVAKQLAATIEVTDFAQNVEVVIPDNLMESLAVQVGGTLVGMVHGHQVNSPDRLTDWWMRQSHGGMPVADADILLAGHFHSLRVQLSGNARTLFVGPASEPGSSWYANLKGERSGSGMLALCVNDGKWSNLEIL